MNTKSFIKKLIPPFVLSLYHYKLSLLSAVLYGFPSKQMTVVGITGTSGKTTTVDLLSKIMEEAGHKVASTSTARFRIAGKEYENKYKMSMPGRFVLQKFLKQAKDAGCDFVILEVTSEGIKQFRHKFINFDTAVFTNLSKEHLESHGSFENYRNAKLKFFKTVKNLHVINADDANAKYFLDVPAKNKITFSINDAQNITTENGLGFEYKGENFLIPLMGRFNVYNALCAITVATAYKASLKDCSNALKTATSIPGRMEIVQQNPFKIIVDYAHTPEQLEVVYKSLKPNPYNLIPNLICVLGSCGGGRDKWKRPVLGQIAEKYCKQIIITNEDPYDENPTEIINQVAEGAKDKAEIILDRKEAITKAVKSARTGDIVIITGKGSEPWMCVANGKKIPWSDKQIAKEVLNNQSVTNLDNV